MILTNKKYIKKKRAFTWSLSRCISLQDSLFSFWITRGGGIRLWEKLIIRWGYHSECHFSRQSRYINFIGRTSVKSTNDRSLRPQSRLNWWNSHPRNRSNSPRYHPPSPKIINKNLLSNETWFSSALCALLCWLTVKNNDFVHLWNYPYRFVPIISI